MAELTDDSKVTIPEDVRRSMEDRLILVSDVVSVIKQAESSGCKLQDSTSGHYIAYLQLVNVTYWVEYSLLDDGFLVHNSYCHRLQIVE